MSISLEHRVNAQLRIYQDEISMFSKMVFAAIVTYFPVPQVMIGTPGIFLNLLFCKPFVSIRPPEVYDQICHTKSLSFVATM